MRLKMNARVSPAIINMSKGVGQPRIGQSAALLKGLASYNGFLSGKRKGMPRNTF